MVAATAVTGLFPYSNCVADLGIIHRMKDILSLRPLGKTGQMIAIEDKLNPSK